ncbi:LysR family transcriptional regulator [Pleionea sp. CnH1-48]|uniref:LysR family transcriptional regulator n=1 Tax=Pleionea sp. CnH1-48 TaxID=2954494 RepID=UPI00209772F8|nr:LysR family transcriptional regulator [Pleionea sp. CnH1-48]MCO7223310.1 LysR family transcriptional regulator [Pleionea sp. CnH1-48]
MDRVTSAKVFVSIVELGSMAAAADALGMSRSMVTRYLSEMESWADARLLHRSTRRLTLTAAGDNCLQSCRQLLAISSEIPKVGQATDQVPKGELRISCSPFIAQVLLEPMIHPFLQRYPEVSIEMLVGNQTLDLVKERIDLSIRISNDLDPNLIARPLGVCHSILCASEEYVSARGQPTQLEDLAHHNCLAYSYFGQSQWNFEHQLGEQLQREAISVQGNFAANETEVLLRATLKGAGISLLPRVSVLPFIDSGELVELLPHYFPVPLGVHGVYRSREYQPLAVRMFLDALIESFQELSL